MGLGRKRALPGTYFKILPKGSCSIAGCLVGFPTWNVSPHGLGHSVAQGAHCFEELGVALPRVELDRREEYKHAMTAYMARAVRGARFCLDTWGRSRRTIAAC